MIEATLWGFFLRFVQSGASAAAFILVGFLVAAVFRTQVGASATRRLFGLPSDPAAPASSRWGPLLRAWGIGMLLPVCSLGAIPVVRELRRIGLPAGTILAFAMTAPLFNPLSLLYGLTLSEPIAILGFAACSLLIVTVLGLAFDRLFPSAAASEVDDAAVPPGWRRVAATGVSMLRDVASTSSLYILLGLFGVAALGVFLPPGAMQTALEADDPLAIPRMLGMAIPVYATPMLAMSQMGMMFSHVNSIGAAFILLVLGAGMNLGLLAWVVREYGFKPASGWFGLLAAVVLVLAYAVDKPLMPEGVEPAGHTHAFDIYCRPFNAGDVAAPREYVFSKLDRTVLPYERRAVYGLLGLAAAGMVLRLSDPRRRLDGWLAASNCPAGRFDVIIPGPVLGGAVLLMLVGLSVVACFAYYPTADEVFEEMSIAKGEALSGALTGEIEHATYWIAKMDDWSRKLEVGSYLRAGHVSDFQKLKGRLLRDKLELLEHEVEELTGPAETGTPVRHLVNDVFHSFARLKRAYET